MFFRLKASGPRSYLQIVESRRDGTRVQQHVIATIGRADELAANGGLASLLASGARFCEQVLLLSALDDEHRAPQLGLAGRLVTLDALHCQRKPSTSPPRPEPI